MTDKKIDPRDIKWFGPLWRRIALAAVMAVWCVFEYLGGDQFWFFMTVVVLLYIIWKLFISFPSAAEIAAFEAENETSEQAKPDAK
jgi:hypothetical protein